MRVVPLASLEQFAAINLLLDPGHTPGKVTVPNGVQVVIRWSLVSGKTAHNVLGISVSGSYTPTATLAEAARAALVAGANWTAYAALLATGTSLAGVDLRDIRVADQPLVSSTGSSTPGTSASPALPSEVAACITLRTAFTGPGNRGRTYLPGFATNALAAGDVIAPAAVTAITNFIQNIGSAMTAAGGTWSLLLPHRNQYTSAATGTLHPERQAHTQQVTAATVRDNHWDTQRRRGLK